MQKQRAEVQEQKTGYVQFARKERLAGENADRRKGSD